MKKFVNDADTFVRESLEGLVLTQPGLALLEGRTIAVQADRVVSGHDVGHGSGGDTRGSSGADREAVPVALISGGGAGHEPAHAGFVGEGMLTAAVSGGVFASPSVDAVLDGIRAVTGSAGALLIVKSYTGDRLNFGLAAQLAEDEGYAVETVVVGDDIALGDADTHAGARGLAGTVLVHKIAGALAASGADLAEVTERARSVTGRLATMGVALRPGTMPGSGEATFEIDEDQIELGLGIHGESGVEQVPHRPADGLAAELVDRVLAARPLDDGARVALLVNGLGGTPPAELSVLTRAAHRLLGERGLRVERTYQGSVMTSLEMAGASVTLLPLEEGEADLLDAPTASLAWPGGDGPVERHDDVPVPEAVADAADPGEPDPQVRAAVDAACQAVLDDESRLTELDQVVGDGDLGEALARGARAWQEHPADGSAAYLLRVLSARCRRAIGGTSGPLYAAGLVAAAQALEDGADWPGALAAGVDGIQELGGAEPGDGTMVDALRPAADAAPDGWEAVLAATEQGVRSTVEGVSRKGRASYVGARGQGHPDPGAEAVLTWLRAVREAGRAG
ncbi:dihydroxyacetone kinase family protein [Arsenicicoccus sp. UBA7492]|uniref:dihydroxyacetone kinase family protein n=1 Tax=Arsenicicoccus sp. UBA7492 TaxID=1946057 RepID=UPI00257F7BAB|nr:dihydroxyacetone kinase family protein [Arsenicicoccus sp. UBA7492]